MHLFCSLKSVKSKTYWINCILPHKVYVNAWLRKASSSAPCWGHFGSSYKKMWSIFSGKSSREHFLFETFPNKINIHRYIVSNSILICCFTLRGRRLTGLVKPEPSTESSSPGKNCAIFLGPLSEITILRSNTKKEIKQCKRKNGMMKNPGP